MEFLLRLGLIDSSYIIHKQKKNWGKLCICLCVFGGLEILLEMNVEDYNYNYVDASLGLFARKSPRSLRDSAGKRALSARRLFFVDGGSIN